MSSRPRSDPGFLAAYGAAIVDLREERSLERRDLAESAGISYSYLSAIESGQKLPSPKLEAAIAAALGVSPTVLLAAANGAVRPLADSADQEFLERGAQRRDERNDLTGWSARWSRASHGRQSSSEVEGLSPSAANAELRVLLEHLQPDDAAMVVALARRLAGQQRTQKRQHRDQDHRWSKDRDLRTSAYLEFWTDYVTKVTNRGLDWIDGRHPEPRSYFTTTSPIRGASISASFARNRLLRHELYINRGSREANLELLSQLADRRKVIEGAYGRPLEFEDPGRERRAVRIAEYREGHISRRDEHGDYVEWFIDAGLAMRRATAAYLEDGGGD
jgi:transcriptional regulator with XRE-family HTH domain